MSNLDSARIQITCRTSVNKEDTSYITGSFSNISRWIAKEPKQLEYNNYQEGPSKFWTQELELYQWNEEEKTHQWAGSFTLFPKDLEYCFQVGDLPLYTSKPPVDAKPQEEPATAQ